MSPSNALAIAGLVFAYALVSGWLADRSVSGPLVFVTIGSVVGLLGMTLVSGDFEGGIEVLAEATLVIILFSDATRIDLARLRSQAAIPVRLLAVGLPLTVVAGTLAGALLFPDLALLEVAVLAAVLSPTDAALGQAVVTDKRVPIRIRQALNVESGLNDGLMVPVVAVLVALAAAESGSPGDWVEFAARQVGFGLVVGIGVGAAGGWLLDWFAGRGWVEGALRQIAVLAIAVAAFTGAEALDGNGFVAAFVAGIAFGALARPECDSATDFAEDEGQLLVLLTFLFWGLLLVAPRLDELTPAIGVYVVLSLTAVRMLPVAIALIGSRLEVATVAYLGWFGPRGLASILFGVFAAEQLDGETGETILLTVTWTVLVSVVVHGLTAVPFARWYGTWFAGMDPTDLDEMPETVVVEPMRTRTGPVGRSEMISDSPDLH
jgi:NhaP-type Na+/H+ or K+/H+ antiporter